MRNSCADEPERSGNVERAGRIKGEITLLIGKAEETGKKPAGKSDVRQRLQQVMAEEKLDEKAAVKKNCERDGSFKERGLPGVAEEPVIRVTHMYPINFGTT